MHSLRVDVAVIKIRRWIAVIHIVFPLLQIRITNKRIRIQRSFFDRVHGFEQIGAGIHNSYSRQTVARGLITESAGGLALVFGGPKRKKD